MSHLMEIIKGRHSIRRYEEREIPEQDLQQVLESIQWSPSWANTQCWEVVVVQDPAQKERLQGTLKDTNPAKKAIEQAPVVLVLCGKVLDFTKVRLPPNLAIGSCLIWV